MRIDAIGLGLLTALLSLSLSARAQVSPDLLDPIRPQPSTGEPETPNSEQSEDAPENVDPGNVDPENVDLETHETEETVEETETNDDEGNNTDESADEENADEVDTAGSEADEEDGSTPESTENEELDDGETTEVSLPPLPEGCEALPLVNGEGNEVTKRTSPPSFTIPIPLPGPIPDPRIQSNWNTDWYISNAQSFNHYRVILMPRSSGRYSIQLFFKYPDDTADRFYEDQEIRLTANEPLIIEAEPRPDLPPYQINANIGGILSIGVRYTIGVAGCRNDEG